METLPSLLPANDTGQFLFGVIISAAMVTPDAFLWQIAAIPALVMLGLKLRGVLVISAMIALTHQLYGMLGLLVRGVGGPFEAIALPVVLGVVTYLIWGFVVHGSIENDEDDTTAEHAQKLLTFGLVSFAAFFGVYTGISIDELFAVLGRVEWMHSQGWSYLVMMANISVAMSLLWLVLSVQGVLLYTITKLTQDTKAMQWILRHEGLAMFFVFSLLVYFVHRGWWQNLLGNKPTELHLGQINTGFAYLVYLAAGLAPLMLLRLAILISPVKNFLLWCFAPQQKLIDTLEKWSEGRAER